MTWIFDSCSKKVPKSLPACLKSLNALAKVFNKVAMQFLWASDRYVLMYQPLKEVQFLLIGSHQITTN